MKITKHMLLALAVLIAAQSTFAQQKFAGRVIEIVDGKTVVIEMQTGKLTAVLQHIEVPEADQPLHATVKEHLGKLVLGKAVTFHPRAIGWRKTFGRLMLGDVDVSQKMLRDGAAWLEPLTRSGQETEENEFYKANEASARAEKRGVWSLNGMKPAWEFRAEKLENERRRKAEAARAAEDVPEQIGRTGAVSYRKLPRAAKPAARSVGPLINNYNEARKTGSIGTPLLKVTELDKESQQVTVIDFTYAYNDADPKARKGRYVLRLFSFANGWRFLKSNHLTILADEQTIVVGKPRRLAKKENDFAGESLQYELKRGVLDRIVNARDVVIKVGDYGILPSEGLQMILYSLLQASDETAGSDVASGGSHLNRSPKIAKKARKP